MKTKTTVFFVDDDDDGNKIGVTRYDRGLHSIIYNHNFENILTNISGFLSYPIYNIWGCVFSVYPIPLWLREYTLCLIIIIKSEVWPIIHCLGLGHETMVCVVCLSIFLRVKYIWADSTISDLIANNGIPKSISILLRSDLRHDMINHPRMTTVCAVLHFSGR